MKAGSSVRRFLRTGVGILRLLLFVLSAWPTWIFLKFAGRLNEQERRARWMQIMCRRSLRILHGRVVMNGMVPTDGLVVANHLGYVDILALGTVMPCAFVAKKSVRGWPVFGWLASMGGTVFVDRDVRVRAAQPIPEIEAILAARVPVVLFPEGTSTDGSHVLPFRTALLAVAERSDLLTTPVTLRYTSEDGLPNRQLAYHGEDVFFPHLLAALGADRTVVHIEFGEPIGEMNRKELGAKLYSIISKSLTTSARDKSHPRASLHTSGGIPQP